MVSWAIAVLAASVIKRAANAIPRVLLGRYIFISFSGLLRSEPRKGQLNMTAKLVVRRYNVGRC